MAFENHTLETSSQFDIENGIRSTEIVIYIPDYKKIRGILIFFVITFPIVFCDLLYGYTDQSCVHMYQRNFNINMKLYLLVSGYTCVVILAYLLVCLTGLCCKPAQAQEPSVYIALILSSMDETIIISSVLLSLFMVAWHGIGGYIYFCLTVYEYNCDANISTYLFVSLLIKLVFYIFVYVVFTRGRGRLL